MKDVYLVRGKRIDGKGWEVGCLYFIPDQPERTPYIFTGELAASAVEEDTLGRCTGIKDKNGQLLFEGDIWQDENGVEFIIVWFDKCAMFEIHGLDHDADDDHVILDLYDDTITHGVITGNVYDHNEKCQSVLMAIHQRTNDWI